jgi:hypothetical protein
MPGDQPRRFLIHDRDSISAAPADAAVTAMGITSPPATADSLLKDIDRVL